MAFTANILSGSTNGRPISVAATADPGTVIHTAPAGTTSIDEIVLSVSNTDTVDRTLIMEDGSNTASDLTQFLVPAGQTIALPPFHLQNALVLKAYSAGTASKLLIWGLVNRIA